MNLLTVIVIILFALFALRGYRRGFVKSLASMISLILSIVLVNFATPYVTDFLKTQTPVYDYILKKCEDMFSVQDIGAGKTDGSARDLTGETGGAEKTLQEQIINGLPIPRVLRNLLKNNNTPEYYKQLAVSSFSEYVPKYMAGLVLSICSFVATFLLVISFIWLAVMTLDMIANLPIIHGINQMLGLALGFFQGLIIVWLVFLIITIFGHTDAGKQLMDMITESPILSGLYDWNILLDILQGAMQKLF